jgi:hypothetical protein
MASTLPFVLGVDLGPSVEASLHLLEAAGLGVERPGDWQPVRPMNSIASTIRRRGIMAGAPRRRDGTNLHPSG